MLKLSHRSYPGQSYRPSPHIEESKLMISMITPWNSKKNEAKKLAQSFLDYYTSLHADQQSTRLYKPKPFLSSDEDNIYSIFHQLNQEVFIAQNTQELNSGFEVCFIIETSNEIIFSNIGHPHIYLDRKNLPLQPLSCSLSTNDSQTSFELAPLPSCLLGVYEEIPISVGSIKKKPEDHLILVSRNYLPSSFIGAQSRSLESLGDTLAKDNQNLPFWLARIEIS